mmetsp:Transcript_12278/g.26204  ORF Transcript_12278/g.26204 Transcript_12278/m.26204 type:complete len:208 (-) Transcript_12278:42-665(-)
MLLNHLLRNESRGILPTSICGRAIHRVVQIKPPRVQFQTLLQLLPDQDIFLRLIGIQQRHLHIRLGLIPQHRMNNLQHGRYSRPSGDHSKVLGSAFLIGIAFQKGVNGEISIFVISHMPFRSSHIDGISDFERVQMLAHLSSLGEFGMQTRFVHFNDKSNHSGGIVPSDGGVGPLMILGSSICQRLGEFQSDVLSDGKAKNAVGSVG